MKIYFKTIPKNIEKDDIIINNNIENNLNCNQISIKEIKTKNYLKYQKKFYKYCKNNPDFKLNRVNLYKVLETFFLRTYNFPNYESLGNILTLIDIFELIKFKKNQKIKFYSSNATIKNIILEISKKKKLKIEFIYIKKINLKPIKFFLISRFFFGLIISKIGRNTNNSNIILTPYINKIDIYKHARSKMKKFEEVYFENKNSLNSLNSIRNLIKKIRNKNILKNYSILKSLKITYIFFKTKNINLKKEIKYKEINIKKNLNIYYNFAYLKFFYFLVLQYYNISNNLLKSKKKIIYSTNDDILLNFIEILKSNCKRFSFQYELIYPGCAYSFSNNEKSTFFVWNQYSKRILIEKYNYNKKNIIVVGNIRFDLTKNSNKNKNKKIICISQDAFPEINKFFIKTFENENINYELYIKPHPSDNINKLEKMVQDTNIKIFQGNLIDVLKSADFIIGYSSTLLIEAILNKINTIIINPYKNSKPYGPELYKYLTYFENKEDLINFFNNNSKTKINFESNEMNIYDINLDLISKHLK